MMSLFHLQLFTVTREFLQRSHIWRGVDCFLWRCLINQHLSTICMVMFNKPSIIGWSHWFRLAALWNQPSLANLRLTSDNNSLEHSKLHVDQVALLRSIRGDETQICGDEICTNTMGWNTNPGGQNPGHKMWGIGDWWQVCRPAPAANSPEVTARAQLLCEVIVRLEVSRYKYRGMKYKYKYRGVKWK